MQQKIIQIGNSIGFIVPQKIRTGLKVGSAIDVTRKGDKIIASPIRATVAKGIDVKFMKELDEFINQHEDVLKELSGR